MLIKKKRVCLAGSKLRQYHERSLLAEERVIINEHLAACDRCYQLYSEMYRLPDSRDYVEINWKTDTSSAHLDFDEELAPYVEGHVNEAEREVIESHLSQCARCAREVRDLQTFAERLKNKP